MAEGHCPPSFICPITYAVMRDPVMCADGRSYEREAITEWRLTHDTNPATNAQLPNKTLTPNYALRNAIEEWSSSFAKAFKVVPRDAITIGRQIGRGSFKTVHEGTYKGGRVAVLKLRAGSCDAEVAALVRLGRRQELVQYTWACAAQRTSSCSSLSMRRMARLTSCWRQGLRRGQQGSAWRTSWP